MVRSETSLLIRLMIRPSGIQRFDMSTGDTGKKVDAGVACSWITCMLVSTQVILGSNSMPRVENPVQKQKPHVAWKNDIGARIRACTIPPCNDRPAATDAKATRIKLANVRSASVFGRNLQGKPVRGVNFREECHLSHACSLQANMRGIQWHPRL
jgi:hypothetical protein